MKNRSKNIQELRLSINKAVDGIAKTRIALANQESKLERQRANLNTQIMLSEFDKVDVLRQQISDLIAFQKLNQHINELELNETGKIT